MGYISRKPESAQAELWSKTTRRQQAEIAAMFQHMKPISQEILAFSLIDYIDEGALPKFEEDELLLATAFVYLTGYGQDASHKWQIQPKKPTENLRQQLYDLFPSFKNLCI